MNIQRNPQRPVLQADCASENGTLPVIATDDGPQFLSEADCHGIANRLAHFARGGGHTSVWITSHWRGNVRWARNQVSTSGEDYNNNVWLQRITAEGDPLAAIEINETNDAALVAALRRAERLIPLGGAKPDVPLLPHYVPEPLSGVPKLFSEATCQLDVAQRDAVIHEVVQRTRQAGLLAAGYLEVSAHSQALITSWGYARYFQYTWAQCSITVRDPKGHGSGWAGVDWPDWNKIDAPTLSQAALDKCLQSRNPVAIEPGRYTTILEPQAVCDFVGQMMWGYWGGGEDIFLKVLDRAWNENAAGAPFNRTPVQEGLLGLSRLGERVIDERITISADPMDPELGVPPFSGPLDLTMRMEVYHPVTWIERGVLTHLAYDRDYGLNALGQNTGLPKSGAFRMSVTGPMTSIEEMIVNTRRGLLVSRFDSDRFLRLDQRDLLLRGYTRDGLWLIERGKISKPVTNMVFTESILFALNNVDQLGIPQRAFHPKEDLTRQPVIVPPLKIRDFSFTALTRAT